MECQYTVSHFYWNEWTLRLTKASVTVRTLRWSSGSFVTGLLKTAQSCFLFEHWWTQLPTKQQALFKMHIYAAIMTNNGSGFIERLVSMVISKAQNGMLTKPWQDWGGWLTCITKENIHITHTRQRNQVVWRPKQTKSTVKSSTAHLNHSILVSSANLAQCKDMSFISLMVSMSLAAHCLN